MKPLRPKKIKNDLNRTCCTVLGRSVSHRDYVLLLFIVKVLLMHRLNMHSVSLSLLRQCGFGYCLYFKGDMSVHLLLFSISEYLHKEFWFFFWNFLLRRFHQGLCSNLIWCQKIFLLLTGDSFSIKAVQSWEIIELPTFLSSLKTTNPPKIDPTGNVFKD